MNIRYVIINIVFWTQKFIFIRNIRNMSFWSKFNDKTARLYELHQSLIFRALTQSFALTVHIYRFGNHDYCINVVQIRNSPFPIVHLVNSPSITWLSFNPRIIRMNLNDFRILNVSSVFMLYIDLLELEVATWYLRR